MSCFIIVQFSYIAIFCNMRSIISQYLQRHSLKKSMRFPIVESDSSNLNGVIAENCSPSSGIVLTLSLIMMYIVRSSPGNGSLASNWAIFIQKDGFPWALEVENSAYRTIKSQITSSHSSSSWISRSRMETMRAWTQCSCIVPIKVEESWVINPEIISSWSNKAKWTSIY